jgi:hypothetical protein
MKLRRSTVAGLAEVALETTRVYQRMIDTAALVEACRRHAIEIQRLLAEVNEGLATGVLLTGTPAERQALVSWISDAQASANRAFDIWTACYAVEMP